MESININILYFGLPRKISDLLDHHIEYFTIVRNMAKEFHSVHVNVRVIYSVIDYVGDINGIKQKWNDADMEFVYAPVSERHRQREILKTSLLLEKYNVNSVNISWDHPTRDLMIYFKQIYARALACEIGLKNISPNEMVIITRTDVTFNNKGGSNIHVTSPTITKDFAIGHISQRVSELLYANEILTFARDNIVDDHAMHNIFVESLKYRMITKEKITIGVHVQDTSFVTDVKTALLYFGNNVAEQVAIYLREPNKEHLQGKKYDQHRTCIDYLNNSYMRSYKKGSLMISEKPIIVARVYKL